MNCEKMNNYAPIICLVLLLMANCAVIALFYDDREGFKDSLNDKVNTHTGDHDLHMTLDDQLKTFIPREVAETRFDSIEESLNHIREQLHLINAKIEK